jgi:Flp pilus assembly protein protease CpaA
LLLEVVVFAFFSLASIWFDFLEKRIPLLFGYGFLLSGLVLSFFNGFLATNFVGVIFSLAFGFALWKFGVWGAGDARLLAALQSWSFLVGGSVFFFVFVFLSSALLLFGWMVLAGKSFEVKNVLVVRKTRSFALFLILGFFCVALLSLVGIRIF